MSNLRAVLFYPSGCDPELLGLLHSLLAESRYEVRDWQQDFTVAQLKPIMNQVWGSVGAAHLVVVVLNRHERDINANVLYEYGFSQGHFFQRNDRRVLTILSRTGDTSTGLPELPFDIQHLLHLVWAPADAAGFEQRFRKEIQDRPVEVVLRHEEELGHAHQRLGTEASPWKRTHQGIVANAKQACTEAASSGEAHAVVAAVGALVPFARALGDALDASVREDRSTRPATEILDRNRERALLSGFFEEAHLGAVPLHPPSAAETDWQDLGRHLEDRTKHVPEIGSSLCRVRRIGWDRWMAGRLLLEGAGLGAIFALLVSFGISLFVSASKSNCIDDFLKLQVCSGIVSGESDQGTASDLGKEVVGALVMLALVMIIALAGIFWRQHVRLGAAILVLVGLGGLYFKPALGRKVGGDGQRSETQQQGETEKQAEKRKADEKRVQALQLARLAALALLGCWLIGRIPTPSQLNLHRAGHLATAWGLKAGLGTAAVSGALLLFQGGYAVWYDSRVVTHISRMLPEEQFAPLLGDLRLYVVPLMTIKHACIVGLVIWGAVRRLHVRPLTG